MEWQGAGTVSPAIPGLAGGRAADLWAFVGDTEDRGDSSRRDPGLRLAYRNTTTWQSRGTGRAEGNCTNAARRWLCTHREPCRLTPAITWLGYSTVCHMVFSTQYTTLRKDRCCGMRAGFTGRAAGAIPLHQNVLDLHSFVNPTAKQSSRVLFHPICREEKHEWPLRGPETSHKTDAQREVHVDPPNPEFGSWTIK